MTFIPNQKLAQTSFGELITAELTPEVQLQFPYNINSSQATIFPGNGGAVTNGDDHANVSTGTNADGFGLIISNDAVKYNAGQGGQWRGTAKFTTGVADSSQIIGIGNTLNGFFFGYDGTDFGILRRSGGDPEAQILTITTASSTAENITITLDGDSISTIPVTASGDPTVTAREISDALYLSVGTGWSASVAGDKVTFISFDTESHPGTYSISGTTVVGSFAQTIASNLVTDSWTNQSDWSVDKMDGTGPSGMTLDKTKGNVYQVCYQWLGYGLISYAIENSETGAFQTVHEIKYANANTSPSIAQPSMRLFMEARNYGNTSDLKLSSASMGGFVQGKDENIGPSYSCDNLFVIGNVTTEEPVVTIRNKVVYQSTINEVRIVPESITLTSNLAANNSNTIFRTYIGATPENGTNYTDVSTNSSVVECDSDALDFDLTEGVIRNTYLVDKVQSIVVPLGDIRDKIGPGLTFMVTAEPSKGNASNEVGASINWRELF